MCNCTSERLPVVRKSLGIIPDEHLKGTAIRADINAVALLTTANAIVNQH
jgi:hypothetical protein